MQQLAVQFAKGDRYARRDVFWITEKPGADSLTPRKRPTKISRQIVRPSSTLMSHGKQAQRPPLRHPLYSRPPNCWTRMPQTKPTKSEVMTCDRCRLKPRSPCNLLAEDLMAFTEFAFGVVRPGILFKPNWHLEAVTHKLSQVAEGEVRRLINTQPPRTLKSLCASVALPAWFLGHYPWERVVVVSYSDHLARAHANDFRRLVNDPLYQATFPSMRLGRRPTARSPPRSGANALQPQSTARSPGSGET